MSMDVLSHKVIGVIPSLTNRVSHLHFIFSPSLVSAVLALRPYKFVK